MQDPKKPPVGPSGSSPFPPANDELDLSSTVDDFFARLHPDMRRPLPTQDAIAAALQTMQRLAAEAAADAGADSSSRARATASCEACGHQNRPGNQFCGKCGRPLALSTAPPPGDDPSPSPSAFPRPGSTARRATSLPSSLSPPLRHTRPGSRRGICFWLGSEQCPQYQVEIARCGRDAEQGRSRGSQGYVGLGCRLQYPASRRSR